MKQYFTTEQFSVSSNRILYTPSVFAKTSLLYLQETGTLQAKMQHKSSRSNLSSYLFFTVLSGSGQLVYEGEQYDLVLGSCVFIDCEKPYSHVTSNDLWNLQWCHFNGPEMRSIYDKYKSRGGKPVFSSSLEYTPLLDLLYSMASSDSYVRDMKINSVLSQLLTNLMEDSWNPGEASTDRQKKIRKVRLYLDENYSLKITLDDLSEQFFIDKYYLCEQFKEQYGISVMDYLISVRITEAKKLIRFTDKTMDEIAYAIGINGAAYFSRLFKKVEGVSPSDFRKMW